jgi:hypothetical protein
MVYYQKKQEGSDRPVAALNARQARTEESDLGRERSKHSRQVYPLEEEQKKQTRQTEIDAYLR